MLCGGYRLTNIVKQRSIIPSYLYSAIMEIHYKEVFEKIVILRFHCIWITVHNPFILVLHKKFLRTIQQIFNMVIVYKVHINYLENFYKTHFISKNVRICIFHNFYNKIDHTELQYQNYHNLQTIRFKNRVGQHFV